MSEELLLSLGSPQCIQTSLHLLRWNTSLNLRHCREIRPSFESASLVVHCTWDSKHSVPLTYLLLRDNSTWGSGGKLAQIFKDRESALILERYWVHGAFLELLYWYKYSYRLATGVSGNLCQFHKEVKPLVLYGVEDGIAIEQMRVKFASSCVDFGYTELFCIPELTSEFISSCDSVLGDSLVFYQENRGSLRV